jgi:hypothetical protein
MADGELRMVLDDWVIPADSVPVMISFGEAIVRVRADLGDAAVQVARLAGAMRTIADTRLALELVRMDALGPATPASPEPGT